MANAGTYKGMYAMHKYWGKKPFNEISKFIEKYSESNDFVMDCFCGSGVTLVEAVKLKRRAIGIDLNPIAIKLAKASLTPINIDEVNKIFKDIKRKLQKKIYSLYEMKYDGEDTMVTHTIWKNGKPIEVWYCTDKIKKKVRVGNEVDKEMMSNPIIAPLWYPETQMYENSRINVGYEQKVSDLFTPRALVGLSLLLDEIKRIKDETIRSVFELTLSGTLSQASNLVFVIRRRKKNKGKEPKAEVGSWVIGYWVPEEHFEINVWNCFENRYKRMIKGEQEIKELFINESDLEQQYRLINGSATKIPIDDNMIDYVFIDPPHINRVLYLEQSLMWNSWLGLDSCIDWDSEIVISEAKNRKDKNIYNYNKLLGESFKEITRVLKPKKYFSFAFNCLDDDTWIDTLNLFIQYGYEIRDIVPLEYSATSVIQDNRTNVLKTDFVLTFQNMENSKLKKIVFKNDDVELKKIIKEILKKNSTYEVYNVMNVLFEMTIPKGYIYRVSKIIKCCSEQMGQK